VSFHLFPFQIKKETRVEGVVTSPLRSGAPTLLAMYGHYAEDDEAIWVVAFEWPEPYTPTREKTSKERQHLNRFAVDFERARGHAPYAAVNPGPDPPDFVCETAGGNRVGVELTQLMLEDRVAASAQFDRVRQAVMAANGYAYRKLQGHVVYIAFEEGDEPVGRPPLGKSDLARVAEELKQLEPYVHAGGDLPETLDPGVVREFPGGRMMTAPLASETGSAFSRLMGFDLALAYATTIEQSSVWDRFAALINRHDQAGVDEIIVSACAPIATGFAFPSDAIVAGAIARQAELAALEAAHVSRVYVHVWDGAAIFLLVPGRLGAEQIAGEIPLS
jgi:hypothetical protein